MNPFSGSFEIQLRNECYQDDVVFAYKVSNYEYRTQRQMDSCTHVEGDHWNSFIAKSPSKS